jgi:hypothetical protein
MSFTCNLTDGYVLGCSSIGGVEKVWIGEWVDNVNILQDSCGIITGITTTGLTVYSFEQDIEHAGLVQTGNYSRENGTVFYESILSIKLITLDCNVRNRMIELGRSPLFGVVKSNAGDYYYLGLESSGRASAGDANLGVLLGDMNGLNQSISWKSANGAYLINGGLIGTTITVA